MQDIINDLSISKLDCFRSDKGTVMHAIKKNSNMAQKRRTFSWAKRRSAIMSATGQVYTKISTRTMSLI